MRVVIPPPTPTNLFLLAMLALSIFLLVDAIKHPASECQALESFSALDTLPPPQQLIDAACAGERAKAGK